MTPESILDALVAEQPALMHMRHSILAAFELMKSCYEQNGVILCCGNGGSAADADHIVGELMKSFRAHRALPAAEATRFADHPQMLDALESALPAISLCAHTSLGTAFSNDVSAEYTYAQQVYGYANMRSALLIALSTSGNSLNVLRAAECAQCMRIPVISLTGMDGGALRDVSTVCLALPSSDTYRVQEYTLPVYHTLCAMVEAYFFP